MKIANIIYEDELVNHTKLDYINYYNKAVAYEEVDKSLPTLYVGWSFMKSCNPENLLFQNADILKKKIITNELYWECSFEESKASHVKGIDKFANQAPYFYFSPKYSYINLDPVFFQLVEMQDLLAALPKTIQYAYVFKRDMIYLLNDNKIWGINLKMFEFFKFNITDIITELSLRVESMHFDDEGVEYQKYYKMFPKFEQLKRYMVSVLSK